MVQTNKAICLILHNLRSAQNVGALFRIADAVGVKKIYLTGYTPTPVDRFGSPRSLGEAGRPNRAILKTALGAENYVAWEGHKNISNLISKLKANSYKLIALEQQLNSVDYKKVKIKGPTAILFGNEVRGINPTILKKCDLIAEIPMRGKKESLNVAVAAGIFLFRLISND
ncbi:MAG: TrmH family RNA methyltransferase [Candidatus Vogelbacteria bacterium]